MNEKEILNQEIHSLEEKIKFLDNQKDKEIWSVTEFLTNLNIEFDKNELEKSSEEPIDIKFREASFQVKAIYDEDRKMVKEYKDDLEKAKNASTLSESLNLREYCPRDISIQEIANLINEILESYILSPEQYGKIDMLFYFNRLDYGINEDCQCVFPNDKIWKRWRSISMVKNGGINFIYWAKNDASDFIEANVGKIIFKNKRP